MDGIDTTAYDEIVVDFIDCKVCNRTIRGETQYKIHVTTATHRKKLDELVAKGEIIPGPDDLKIPDFKDIKEYFRFIELDEPIIGLSELQEIEPVLGNATPGPSYLCRLCDTSNHMTNMANHVIGRKHRLRYLNVKRPDLVTWDPTSWDMQASGKVVRAKAEVVERQDGQGSPKPLRKKVVGPISKVPSKKQSDQKTNVKPMKPLREADQRGGQTGGRPRGFVKQSFSAHPAEGRDHHRERPPGNDPRALHYRMEDVYDAERAAYHQDDSRRLEYMEEEQRRVDYLEEGVDRWEEGSTRPRDREDAHHRQEYLEEVPHGRPYQENDPLKQFYSQEVLKRGAARSAETPQDRAFHEDESRRRGHHVDDHPRGPEYPGAVSYDEEGKRYYEHSHGREYGQGTSSGRGAPEDPYSEHARRGIHHEDEDHRTGSYYEDEAYRQAYPKGRSQGLDAPEADPHRQSQHRDPNSRGYPETGNRKAAGNQDHLFELIKAFRQEGKGGHQSQGERVPAGPDKRGPPLSQRPPEGGRVRRDIPEPFRQFLFGNAADKGKRKRESRFSDATTEEVNMVKKMHGSEHSERGMRTDPHVTQGVYPGASSAMPASSSTAENVMDVLSNLEIQNVDEANFLTEKLSSVLKEFQAQKLEKAGHTRHGPPPVVTKDYNHMSQAPGASVRDLYEQQQQRMQEQRMQEQRMEEQRMEEQRMEEQRMEEQRMEERRMEERRMEERRMEEQRMEEQRLEEQRLEEQRMEEQRLEEQHMQERRMEEQRMEEQRMEEQYMEERRMEEHLMHEQRRQGQRMQERRMQGHGHDRRMQEHGHDRRMQGHGHDRHADSRNGRRSTYEVVFEQDARYPPRHGRAEEPGMRPEDSMYPLDYPPAPEDMYDPFSPPRSSHREYDYRRPSGPQHPTSLGKITATLLELVARK